MRVYTKRNHSAQNQHDGERDNVTWHDEVSSKPHQVFCSVYQHRSISRINTESQYKHALLELVSRCKKSRTNDAYFSFVDGLPRVVAESGERELHSVPL